MERRAIWVRGTVQGVGFRPFVHGLASRLRLGGFVRNQTGGVCIEVEGETQSLDRFLEQLTAQPPPLARIEEVYWERQDPQGAHSFRIEHSDCEPGGPVVVSPDVAACEQCLAEMSDPRDRRYGYPFLNCTNCGPRLTIVTGAPYDRQRTTMASFAICPACRKEYEDPANRRFHAQPTACPVCGPRLEAVDGSGQRVRTDDPLAWFAQALRAGRIGAMKGLGGYHLICDARNGASVAELRRRKHRDEKPFAIMVATLEEAEALCCVDAVERELLTSSRRPIVLLRKRDVEAPDVHPGLRSGLGAEVAPGNPFMGVMLPYTPLHHLLLRAMAGVPLVMTSGNRSDEPIAYQDEEAIERLAGIADLFLIHNRPIHVRCDDSVTRVIAGEESPVRRSRGHAPQPVRLPMACPAPMLAVGGQLKATFALGRDHHAILSHHLGDLDHFEAYRAFERDVALYQDLFAVTPQCIVHDLHPDYASTRYARRRAADEGVRTIAVQHHHAHMASCMAEHGLSGPVIGVTLDGTGFGTDGAVWGGEFLVGDYGQFRRAAHLRYVGLPGGDRAIREPWRMAVAHLLDADCPVPDALRQRLAPAALRTVQMMLQRRLNTPPTSSAGRLFDAVAALAGVRDCVSYEGQAAIELEWLAMGVPPCGGSYPFGLTEALDEAAPLAKEWLIDTRPLIRSVAEDTERAEPASLIARRFHATVAQLIVEACGRIRSSSGLNRVVLSGGVFLNALLSRETSAQLSNAGFRVYRHRLVPPNDGGLSLGQLAVAAQRLIHGGEDSAGARQQQMKGVADVSGHPREGHQDVPRT